MAYGQYRDRYGGGEQASQGLGVGPILAVGLVLLVVGAVVVVHALSGGAQLPPAAAQQIPVTVKTTSPRGPDPLTVAAALAPSTPMKIEIPAIGVRAPITHVGRNSDGTVQVPPLDNHNLAAWYDGSVLPGQDGSSVILGHVDTYQGPSVFYYIKNLRRGDAIDVIRADGSTAVFTVIGVEAASKTNFPTGAVYGNVPYPALRLVTCGGPFDPARGSYLDNIVVYAYLTGVAAG
jgi:Sortase domain